MQPFRAIFVSVGVSIALGNAAMGNAAPVSEPSQKPQSKSFSRVSSTVAGSLQPLSETARRLRQSIALGIELAQNAPSTGQTPPGSSPPASPGTPATPPSVAPGSPANSQPNSPGSIPPVPDIDTESIGKPIGPAKAGAAPEYLNPEPNPLLVPTKPGQVKVRGVQPITLKQALELAERNSLVYRADQFRLERSITLLRQAQAALYPTLQFQGAFTQSESPATKLGNRVSAVPSPLISQTFNAGLSVNYDLFTFGRRPATIRAAGQQYRQDQLQVEITREQLRLDISNAYYDLQSSDSAVRIQQAAVRNAQASLRDTQALERAGIGTRFDVLQAQGQVATFQIQLTTALGQQQINRRRLAQLLNISPEVDLAAADPVEIAGTWAMSLEDSIILAFQNRAELPQALAAREQAVQGRKAALASLLPTVVLSAQYQVLDNFLSEFRPANGYQVSATVNWNIFDGGQARAIAAQRETEIALAENQFAANRNQVRFDVENAYASLLSNQTNITTARISVNNGQEQLRLARLRFQAGVGTQTDVVNAENNLTAAQGNLVNAILGYNRALAALQRATTNLPIPTGQRTPPLSPGPANPAATPTPTSAKPQSPKGAAALR